MKVKKKVMLFENCDINLSYVHMLENEINSIYDYYRLRKESISRRSQELIENLCAEKAKIEREIATENNERLAILKKFKIRVSSVTYKKGKELRYIVCGENFLGKEVIGIHLIIKDKSYDVLVRFSDNSMYIFGIGNDNITNYACL
jgi:hypothetical protein